MSRGRLGSVSTNKQEVGRERAGQDARDRASLPGEDDSGKLREAALECLEIVDDFDPAYEFEVVEGC